MELRWWNVRLIGVILLAAGAGLVQAQVDPPSLRCASVQGSDVRLDWVNVPGQAGLIDHYEIFQANAPAGPYNLVATVPDVPETYLHAGVGADTGARYYFMRAVSTGPPAETSQPGDTLATMFIQVTQSVPLGSAVVDWNLSHDPPLATQQPLVVMNQGHSVAGLQGIGQLPNTVHHWQRVVDECDVNLVFMVEATDNSGCTSLSNTAGDHFLDITPPSIPVIKAATVDLATNRAQLQWEPSPEPDTEGYIVVLASNGNAILDTVHGRLNTSYTWALSQAGSAPESYTVAAIDTCLRGTPPSPNTSAASAPHTTVHVQTMLDRCESTITVQRTDYVGWEVDRYEIYEQVNGGSPFLVAVLGPQQYQYKAIGLQTGHTYCFWAKAIGVDPDHEVLSNKSCRIASYPAVPQWNYIRTVTVEGPERVRVVDSLDLAGYNRELVLERSHNGLPFEVVGSVAGGIGPVVTWVDEDVKTGLRSYMYRITVKDSCGALVATSNLGNTILLNVDPGPDGINQLRWNGYVGWEGEVESYTVYRSIADGPFEPVGTTTDWHLADNVQDFANTPGKFCYYVVAQEVGNSSAINALSTSNVACAVQEEVVWIPNAFIEGGYNHTFKPVLAYMDVERYELIIYNRWGQQIWSTNNRDEAWDGRVDGTVVPMGVYAYYCSFINGAGKTVVRSGTVTFLPGL